MVGSDVITGLVHPLLAEGGMEGGILNLVLMFGVIFAIMYFLMIRPQKKQEERRKTMVASLKKNDKVMTNGGIYGIVVKVKDDTVILKVDEAKGIQVTFSQQAILGKVDGENKSKQDKEEKTESSKGKGKKKARN